MFLVTMLREKHFLKSLKLKFCEQCLKGFCEVCSALEVNTTLTSLHLSMNTMNEQIIASLSKFMYFICACKYYSSGQEVNLLYALRSTFNV